MRAKPNNIIKKLLSMAGGAALAALLALSLLACGGGGEPATSQAAEQEAKVLPASEFEVEYPSRGISAPAVVCLPEREDGARVPLAVILHGHGGTNEGLAFIARALSDRGVASIRMDFSGCGRSREPFTENNLTNMKADALAAISYMQENHGADPGLVGLIGYSMGGRAALELIAEGSVDPYAMLLIAPAASTEGLVDLFGGADEWERMKAEAQDAGSSGYFTGYYTQQLGPEFFRAIEAYDDPTPKACALFHGKAAVAASRDDFVVPFEVSQSVALALSAKTCFFDNAGHACGLYSSPEDPTLKAVIGIAEEVFSVDNIANFE